MLLTHDIFDLFYRPSELASVNIVCQVTQLSVLTVILGFSPYYCSVVCSVGYCCKSIFNQNKQIQHSVDFLL